MTKKFSFELVFSVPLSLQALAAPKLPVADKSWEKLGEEDGIVTYRKDVPGSSIVAFRGETTIDGNMAKVASVLYDTSRKLEWVAKIVSAKDIRQISEHERIEYNHTASGFFLVRDRDFVFHAKAELDRPNKQMVLTLNSVEDPLMPETDKVRGEIQHGLYVLTSLENDTKTHLVVEIQADPKGAVPKWLVNLFQKSWPRTTLRNIQKQVAKEDVMELASVRKYFFESEEATATSAVKKPVLKKVR